MTAPCVGACLALCELSVRRAIQSLEIAAAFAFATNRTLVFPPAWNMYLRGKSGLEDYFNLEHIVKGLPVIMYSDFHKLIGWKRPGDSQQGAVGQPGCESPLARSCPPACGDDRVDDDASLMPHLRTDAPSLICA